MHNDAALNGAGMEFDGMLSPGCRGKLQTQGKNAASVNSFLPQELEGH